jgi:branched-chain amino acid transport system substrate-binding protein
MVANMGKKYYLLTVDYAWGRSVSGRFHNNLKKLGANIIGEMFYPLGTKDFASYMGSIKAAKPDILIITAAGNDAISVVTQTHRYGIKKLMKICGEGPLVTESLLPAMRDAADGIIAVDYYAATLDTPGNKSWLARYQKLYKSLPTRHSLSSYTAVRWLAQAVKKAGAVESNKVIAALEGSQYTCPVREITVAMDPKSHQALLPVYILKIVNGQRSIIAKQD